MCCEEDLKLFLDNPASFILPGANISLPSILPKKKSQSEVKALFPKQFEMNGFCSVCYVEGKKKQVLKCLFYDSLYYMFNVIAMNVLSLATPIM